MLQILKAAEWIVLIALYVQVCVRILVYVRVCVFTLGRRKLDLTINFFHSHTTIFQIIYLLIGDKFSVLLSHITANIEYVIYLPSVTVHKTSTDLLILIVNENF